MNILSIIGRVNPLFNEDIATFSTSIENLVSNSSFLVLGGGGTIGQAVVKEIFKRNPQKLHVVDINENNLTELVRDIRSSLGHIIGDFRTFSLDIGSPIYDAFIKNDGQYDYVLNLSALKHVRSEKDPYTLMRMIEVNILNTEKTLLQSIECGVKKYFCVSTDKAANPVNMMGASKRIMEEVLMSRSNQIAISTARFANVAFSDGSLLYGFSQRIQKNQPLAGPDDVKRFFVTPQESGELCLMSCLFGENRDIFFPVLSEDTDMMNFVQIAENYLNELGLKPRYCNSEDEARSMIETCKKSGSWPCYFSPSDTTGEKAFEEFYRTDEVLDLNRFKRIGIVKHEQSNDKDLTNEFVQTIKTMIKQGSWDKSDLVDLFNSMLPEFNYEDKGKYLDAKM
jgi:FlaA1/EpsC-like NDP-sugar epimerase